MRNGKPRYPSILNRDPLNYRLISAIQATNYAAEQCAPREACAKRSRIKNEHRNVWRRKRCRHARPGRTNTYVTCPRADASTRKIGPAPQREGAAGRHCILIRPRALAFFNQVYGLIPLGNRARRKFNIEEERAEYMGAQIRSPKDSRALN